MTEFKFLEKDLQNFLNLPEPSREEKEDYLNKMLARYNLTLKGYDSPNYGMNKIDTNNYYPTLI